MPGNTRPTYCSPVAGLRTMRKNWADWPFLHFCYFFFMAILSSLFIALHIDFLEASLGVISVMETYCGSLVYQSTSYLDGTRGRRTQIM